MQKNSLQSVLKQLNQTLKYFWLAGFVAVVLRAVLVFLLIALAWLYINPEQFSGAIWLALLVSSGLHLPEVYWHRKRQIKTNDLLLSLDIKEKSETSVFELRHVEPNDFWSSKLNQLTLETKSNEKKLFYKKFSTVLLPILILFLTLFFETNRSNFGNLLHYFSQQFRYDVELLVVSGDVKQVEQQSYKLSKLFPKKLKLYPDNILKISLRNFRTINNNNPVITLRKTNNQKYDLKDVYQAFQARKQVDNQFVYNLDFSATESIAIFVDDVSRTRPLAYIELEKPPIPQVELDLISKLEEEWHDDVPLILGISVTAHNPLEQIQLRIISGKKESIEVVSKVMAADLHNYQDDYELLLEPYIEEDLSEVQVVAEAQDRSSPVPFWGRSKVISINTSSAYGRYRQALTTLSNLKSKVDEAVTDPKKIIDKESVDLVSKVLNRAARTPFFDVQDRYIIEEIKFKTESLVKNNNRETLMQLFEQLNNFLFEHEMLDDRERDRDFFVASAALTRLLQTRSVNSEKTDHAFKQLEKFLDERLLRWNLRIARLDGEVVNKWEDVKSGLFQSSLSKIRSLYSSSQITNTQRDILKMNDNYKSWIESLEKAEDNFYEKQQNEQQEGIANARQIIKELQKNQDEISASLDKAHLQEAETLKQDWRINGPKQKSNLSKTENVISQLSSLSPHAAERIEVAKLAMELVLSHGEAEDFIKAESNSDLASRYLRQADQAAKSSAQDKKGAGRRRKVGGDQYHGPNVVSGDIQVRYEYEVDSKYREAILRQVKSSNLEDDSKPIENEYLRRIIR